MLVLTLLLNALGQAAAPDEPLLLLRQGQFTKARETLRGLIERSSDKPALDRAGLWQLMAMANNSLAQYKEVLEASREGLQLCEQASPRDAAPVAAVLLVVRAQAQVSLSDFPGATASLRRAQAAADRDLKPDDPRFAFIWEGRAMIYRFQGQLSRAEEAFRKALEILDRKDAPERPEKWPILGSLAAVLENRGRHAEATEMHRRCAEGLARALGPNHPEAIDARVRLAMSIMNGAPAGRKGGGFANPSRDVAGEAEAILREAIGTWRATQPERNPAYSSMLCTLARARYLQGNAQEALALSARSLEIMRSVHGDADSKVVARMYDHARLLAAAKQKKQASVLRKEADRIREVNGFAESSRHTVDVMDLSRPR